MIPAIPPVLLAFGAALSWVSAVGLLWAAFRASPRVGALTERAVIAVLISLFLTAYSAVAYSRDIRLLDEPTTAFVLRSGALLLSTIAPVWLYLYFTGRLGDG